ncbi:hypothetical protein, partial [Calothrix sp. UHCC 0171]|uniref:hypothetical protein n=1 Tax=Calothrix sp. UHCC 0171 TaxID=3110245 RepID=UPI002B1F1A09
IVNWYYPLGDLRKGNYPSCCCSGQDAHTTTIFGTLFPGNLLNKVPGLWYWGAKDYLLHKNQCHISKRENINL